MPPLVIAGAIAGAASIGGAVLSSRSQSRAASQAADAQTQNTAANNALARELYGRNTQNFQPYMQTGQQAMGVLNGLLFGDPVQGGQAPAGTGGQFQGQAPNGGGMSALYGSPGPQSPATFYDGNQDLGAPNQFGLMGQDASSYAQPASGGVTAPNAQGAWDTFRNSTNYKFRLGEGMNALNQGYAGIGALNSGAAVKDSIRYGQEFAGNELARYMQLLQGQQNLGFGGAQALAGVSNNYGQSVMSNNQNAADAASNAALLRGQATSNMWGGIAGGLGNLAGSFASSFGK